LVWSFLYGALWGGAVRVGAVLGGNDDLRVGRVSDAELPGERGNLGAEIIGRDGMGRRRKNLPGALDAKPSVEVRELAEDR
jgi:hypothetical protein